MKKLHSINWYYLAGTIPFCLGLTGMSLKLADAVWQKGLILAAGCAVIFWIVRKFWYLPRPEREYGELKAYELGLPEAFNVRTYLCQELDRYDFLQRGIEILSPLFRRPGEDFKIVISPKLLCEQGEDLVRIAVMREILRYRRAVQARISLGLVTPALAFACLVEGYFVWEWKEQLKFLAGYTNFFGPVLIALFVICFLLVWNGQVSRLDYQSDKALKQYFSREEIAEYIEKWDQLFAGGSQEENAKSRQLEQFYVRQRIARL